MLSDANLKGKLRNKLWAECANYNTNVENLLASTRTNVIPPWVNQTIFKKRLQNLKIFGTTAIIKTANDIQGKIMNRGTKMMFVGYADNHSTEVYRFLNLETKRIVLSRDAIWVGSQQPTPLPRTPMVDDNDGDERHDDGPQLISDDESDSETIRWEGRRNFGNDNPVGGMVFDDEDEDESENGEENKTPCTPRGL